MSFKDAWFQKKNYWSFLEIFFTISITAGTHGRRILGRIWFAHLTCYTVAFRTYGKEWDTKWANRTRSAIRLLCVLPITPNHDIRKNPLNPQIDLRNMLESGPISKPWCFQVLFQFPYLEVPFGSTREQSNSISKYWPYWYYVCRKDHFGMSIIFSIMLI